MLLSDYNSSQVVSPEELWLQLSLDPEGDLERISQRIRALGLQRVGQVGAAEGGAGRGRGWGR